MSKHPLPPPSYKLFLPLQYLVYIKWLLKILILNNQRMINGDSGNRILVLPNTLDSFSFSMGLNSKIL